MRTTLVANAAAIQRGDLWVLFFALSQVSIDDNNASVNKSASKQAHFENDPYLAVRQRQRRPAILRANQDVGAQSAWSRHLFN
jgi:hypothetical protein